MPKANILLVEDDQNLGFILKDYLEMMDYKVEWRENGNQGLEAYNQLRDQLDLCVFDVMMPDKDGFSLAQDIRQVNTDIPIVFLTARNMKEDRIRGLKLGADDYITKPFSTEEFLLRMENILRRYHKPSQAARTEPRAVESTHQLGNMTFDESNQTLVWPGGERSLTRRETEMLGLLCQYKNRLLRREVALKEIWGEEDYFTGRSMDVYITKLRKYFKDNPEVSIVNVHGAGFKLEIIDPAQADKDPSQG